MLLQMSETDLQIIFFNRKVGDYEKKTFYMCNRPDTSFE